MAWAASSAARVEAFDQGGGGRAFAAGEVGLDQHEAQRQVAGAGVERGAEGLEGGGVHDGLSRDWPR